MKNTCYGVNFCKICENLQTLNLDNKNTIFPEQLLLSNSLGISGSCVKDGLKVFSFLGPLRRRSTCSQCAM